MKHLFVLLIVLLPALTLSAQNVDALSQNRGGQVCPAMSNTALKTAKNVDLHLNRSMNAGRNMLISAGVMTVVGAAFYGSAWGLMGDSGSAADIFSISGVSLMGISVPLYIAGSILYVKGKRSMLQPTASGVKLYF